MADPIFDITGLTGTAGLEAFDGRIEPLDVDEASNGATTGAGHTERGGVPPIPRPDGSASLFFPFAGADPAVERAADPHSRDGGAQSFGQVCRDHPDGLSPAAPVGPFIHDTEVSDA